MKTVPRITSLLLSAALGTFIGCTSEPSVPIPDRRTLAIKTEVGTLYDRIAQIEKTPSNECDSGCSPGPLRTQDLRKEAFGLNVYDLAGDTYFNVRKLGSKQRTPLLQTAAALAQKMDSSVSFYEILYDLAKQDIILAVNQPGPFTEPDLAFLTSLAEQGGIKRSEHDHYLIAQSYEAVSLGFKELKPVDEVTKRLSFAQRLVSSSNIDVQQDERDLASKVYGQVLKNIDVPSDAQQFLQIARTLAKRCNLDPTHLETALSNQIYQHIEALGAHAPLEKMLVQITLAKSLEHANGSERFTHQENIVAAAYQFAEEAFVKDSNYKDEIEKRVQMADTTASALGIETQPFKHSLIRRMYEQLEHTLNHSNYCRTAQKASLLHDLSEAWNIDVTPFEQNLAQRVYDKILEHIEAELSIPS